MIHRRIRVAVVGTGAIATGAHIPAYKRNDDVDLVALVDTDENRASKVAKKFGVRKFYKSVEELFSKEDVDAISICTPPNTHAGIAVAALKSGAHVFCEKPMALNEEDGKMMLETSKKEKRILMIGFNFRFRPNYKLARSIALNGRLGHVYLVEYAYLTPNPLLEWGKSPWFFSPETGGGVLLDQGPHVFDMINYIFGDFPIAVSAHASTYFDSGVEDSCVFTLEYPHNRTGVGVISWLASSVVENLSIHGTSQSLFVSPKSLVGQNPTYFSEVFTWRNVTKSLIQMKFPDFPLFENGRYNMYQLEIDEFIKNIKSGLKFSNSSVCGLNVLLAINAAKESLKQERKVMFSPFKPLDGEFC